MDLLIICIAVVLFLGSVIGSIAGNMIASELYDWAPTLARWTIERAVARLPKNSRTRYREEWLADNNDHAGKIGKVCHALGCYFASTRLATDVSPQPPEQS